MGILFWKRIDQSAYFPAENGWRRNVRGIARAGQGDVLEKKRWKAGGKVQLEIHPSKRSSRLARASQLRGADVGEEGATVNALIKKSGKEK